MRFESTTQAFNMNRVSRSRRKKFPRAHRNIFPEPENKCRG
jgi:hypothetical protein